MDLTYDEPFMCQEFIYKLAIEKKKKLLLVLHNSYIFSLLNKIFN